MSVAVGIGHPDDGVRSRGDREVDRDRHDDAARRGDRRLQRLARGVELAAGELELQLDGDHEEEDREQAVLDPVRDRQLEDAGDADVLVHEVVDRRADRRVGDDQAERGRGQQHDRGEARGAKQGHAGLPSESKSSDAPRHTIGRDTSAKQPRR